MGDMPRETMELESGGSQTQEPAAGTTMTGTTLGLAGCVLVVVGVALGCALGFLLWGGERGGEPATVPETPAASREIEGISMCWAPLLEEDTRGFFFRQEHVVPHIGFIPALFTPASEMNARVAPFPDYDYAVETELLLGRLQNLDVGAGLDTLMGDTNNADEDEIVTEIKFFDQKINLLATVMSATITYGASLEEVSFFFFGFEAATMDAIHLVWREKVKHNLVRPTTVVQFLKENVTELRLWKRGGEGEDNRVKIPGNEFHPLVRTMPHAEYPSGSACMCTAIEDVCRGSLGFIFPNGVPNLTDSSATPVPVDDAAWILRGGGLPTGYKRPDRDFTLAELRERCGETRLESGVHFSASVPAAETLCKDLGTMMFNTHMRTILANDGDDAAARALLAATEAGSGGTEGDVSFDPGCIAETDASIENHFKLPTFDGEWLRTVMGFPDHVSKHVMLFIDSGASLVPFGMQRETPVAVHAVWAQSVALWNCVAAFNADQTLKQLAHSPEGDPSRHKRWTPTVTEAHRTSDARLICYVHAMAAIIPTLYGEQTLQEHGTAARGWLGRRGNVEIFKLTGASMGIPEELQTECGVFPDTDRRQECVADYIGCRGNTPQAMGQGIAFDVAYSFTRDGWNSEGTCSDPEFCPRFADVTSANHPELYSPEKGTCANWKINAAGQIVDMTVEHDDRVE